MPNGHCSPYWEDLGSALINHVFRLLFVDRRNLLFTSVGEITRYYDLKFVCVSAISRYLQRKDCSVKNVIAKGSYFFVDI